MKHQHSASRRNFLKFGTGLASLGMMGLGLGSRSAQAAVQVNDYKALVCIYLFGGNDGNNMIVPMDSARYTSYQAGRGVLALTGNKLLNPIADATGNPYALHYGMPEINTLYNAGDVAFVLNTGMLEKPITRDDYLAGLNTPPNLFSHSDQTVQAQTGFPTVNGKGWGGTMLDSMGGGSDNLEAISVTSPALYLQGAAVRGNVLVPGSNLTLYGMNIWPSTAATARRDTVDQIMTQDGGHLLRQAANAIFTNGLDLSDELASAANLPALTTTFPGTSIGNQLKEVMRLIRLRAQTGTGRQIFFCSVDGFDTHSSQDWNHWNLLSQLSQAVGAFQAAAQEVGLYDQITTFTQSEFGRTFQPNSTGTDHAWGNHQLVVGGAVQGGIYGDMPNFELGGADDISSRGIWLPKISTAQFGATLGRWFGVDDTGLATAFPNLAEFSSSDVGFMG